MGPIMGYVNRALIIPTKVKAEHQHFHKRNKLYNLLSKPPSMDHLFDPHHKTIIECLTFTNEITSNKARENRPIIIDLHVSCS